MKNLGNVDGGSTGAWRRAAVAGWFVLAGTAAACGRIEGEEPRAGDRGSEAAQQVSGEQVRRHMEALAADGMEGRETGSEGHRRAADYVARQFAALGLSPLAPGGDFFQRLELLETRLIPESAGLRLRGDGAEVELVFGEDFVRPGGFGDADEAIEASVVFVGYGVRAPELGHDDVSGVETAGRVLAVLSGAPPHFPTDPRAYYSSGQVKQALAASLGAVGLLTVRTPVDRERRPWDRLLARVGSPSMRWIDADGRPHDAFAQLAGSATLSQAGAEKLFALAGRDLDDVFERHAAGETGSFEMGVSVAARRRSSQRRVVSANVVGRLPGSDPRLRGEALLYTAHLDHLGLAAEGVEGDAVYNGAYDNAAGVAAVLEIARVMAGRPRAPRRTVLFAALTAEEQGLRGSSYLAHHPPPSVRRIVANLNLDMPYLGFPPANVEAFGVEHSSLQEVLSDAARAAGLELTPDSMPEEVRFVRSDQFSFVQQGIPSLNFKPGSRSADPSIDGAARLADFLENHYHRASDDLDLPFSAEGARRFVAAILIAGLWVADDEEPPRWNDGDFFAETFAGR